jgi:hypothetical protein
MPKSPQRPFEFGDVVKVLYRGGRPGVVISAASHNATALDVVVMMITTKEQHAMRGGAIVLDSWEKYGLDEPSIVKPIIFSYDVQDAQWIGHVDDDVKALLRQSMARIFGGTVKKK